MSIPQDFEQILWDDWINCYWVETVSRYTPILFLKVTKFKHKDDLKDEPKDDLRTELKPDLKGENEILTQFVRGEDGYTYKQTMPTRGDVVLVPIYQYNKEIF